MALLFFRPRPKDLGAQFISLTTPFGTITVNTTNRFGLGSVNGRADTAAAPGHTAWIDEVFVSTRVVPADADGTILLNVFKYDASADADVQLVTSFDLETLTVGESSRVPLDSGVTDNQRILDFGDFLHFTIVNNSAAIDTQAAGAAVTALVKLLT